MPVEHKFNVLLSLIDEYSKPTWKDQMLGYYFDLLGTNVANPAHAIDSAEHGQRPQQWAVDDAGFASLYVTALRDVREERAMRDARRAECDRIAAALLATTRLLAAERGAAA